jgi:two-component system cell cycle response regulator
LEEKITILAVDDSVVNLKLIKAILDKQNYEVITQQDSSAAVKQILELRPTLVLMDIMMPGISGFDILQRAQKDDEIKDIPIIMVTARTTGEDLKKALEMGAYDYIKKPLDECEIIARVASAIRYKKQNDRLKELAVRDSLTGLYNHGLLMELLNREVYNQTRENFSLGFFMLDVDHFKSVNDQYGHQAGDFVLKELSGILTATFRLGDSLGRYGGEEFAVILPKVDLPTAEMLGERIRAKIEQHPFGFEEKTLNITISIGIVINDDEAPMSAAELVKNADMALYTAKREGRNRVVVHQGKNQG